MNEKKPFLSILIPTRNRAAYLPFAIKSALAIESDDIEVLVSENHSSDNSDKVLEEFSDPRLFKYVPTSALPMHENWEFLLEKARGEWIYFLGDDDAILPYVVDELKEITSRNPWAEALVSPRAYYFWDGLRDQYGENVYTVNFSNKEVWRDSKVMLDRCLRGNNDYLSLPQLYSGGFQKRTLVDRIILSQGGHYFRSVTPDAYSALAACLHTFRYLDIGWPLALVGTSPSQTNKTSSVVAKNREADFMGMHKSGALTLNPLLGNWKHITFTLCFFEAYIQAFPFVPYEKISQKFARKIYFDSVYKFRKSRNYDAIDDLSDVLGFPVPAKYNIYLINKGLASLMRRVISRISRLRNLGASNKAGCLANFKSTNRNEFPTIIHAAQHAAEIYKSFKRDAQSQQLG